MGVYDAIDSKHLVVLSTSQRFVFPTRSTFVEAIAPLIERVAGPHRPSRSSLTRLHGALPSLFVVRDGTARIDRLETAARNSSSLCHSI